MNQEGGRGDAGRIDGRQLEEAVDALVESDDAYDPETVRTVLETATEDGVVRWSAVEDELAHASKVVSTPETRAELASMELEEAREAAESVADLDVVRTRLDAFESRLATIERRVDGLGNDLQRLLDRSNEPGALFEVASGTRALVDEANDVQRAADELQLDVEEFRRWLGDADVRFDDLDADADALESALDELAAAADRLASPAGDDAPESPGDETDAPPSGPDAATTWADATLRTRVMELLLDDLRGELSELRRWADRDGVGGDRGDELRARLDDLDARRATIEDRLDERARPAWRERYGTQVREFEADLAEFEPPVDWGEVQAELRSHLSALEPQT
jgi:hypothetical protein